MIPDEFGRMPDGSLIRQAELCSNQLSARVISYGAALVDLQITLPSGRRRLVLGFGNAEDYLAHSPHFGATVGRYAGKIRAGKVAIDGAKVQLSCNMAGKHHVHGGNSGFGKLNWALDTTSPDQVSFRLVSPAGQEGYPGVLSAFCTYRLEGPVLKITMTATTDAPTPINLLHHSYFNLDGFGMIDAHSLVIQANEILEQGADGFPTGRFVAINPGSFDFRSLRRVATGADLDLSYRLAEDATNEPRHAATLVAGSGDLEMQVWTTEPGLHLYDAYKLSVPVPGHDGAFYGPRSGVCLEPTRFSDAPNHPALPETILQPGGIYRQVTEFRYNPL